MLDYEIISGFVYNDKATKSTIMLITKTFKKFTAYNTRHGLLFTLKDTNVPFDVYDYKDNQLVEFLGNNFGKENNYTFKARAIYRDNECLMFLLPCESKKCKQLKRLIRNMEEFIDRLNDKLDNKITVYITIKKTINLKELQDHMHENGLKKGTDEANNFLTVIEEHGYNRLLEISKKHNIFTKKYTTLLNTIIRLCVYESQKLFDPTDLSVKDKMVDEYIDE
jgi:hypothetical protein